MKALVSANDDRILGFTMIGSEAGEVMAADPDRDDGGAAICEVARRRHLAPYDERRSGLAVRLGSGALCLMERTNVHAAMASAKAHERLSAHA